VSVVERPYGQWFCVAAAAALVAACDPREVVMTTSDGGKQTVDEPDNDDAGPKTMSTGGSSASQPFWLGDGGLLLPDSVCSLRVGATCDGAEDCEHGRVCCGEFDARFVTYRKIGCKESCSAQDEFEFCHAGDSCRPGLVCRRSLIAPFDFIGVCVVPPMQAKPEPVEGPSVAGEITCGAERCDTRSEQCCLRTRISAANPQEALTPFCTERGASCDCNQVPPDGQDAGGPGDDDADAGR
jgi:hypothetical protein